MLNMASNAQRKEGLKLVRSMLFMFLMSRFKVLIKKWNLYTVFFT